MQKLFLSRNGVCNDMENIELILSILVISHNQRELLKRCMKSILTQNLSVSYEVIISDDRSTDGTWELIEEYQQQYPDLVFGYKCNSDECNPTNRSERCGWNKLNAYRHARGKYFVNIDADDCLKSNDIYQLQIDALEANLECSMCQQQVWQVSDGKDISTGFAWPNSEILAAGKILTPRNIILDGLRGLNQSYMIRRNPEIDVAFLYGKHYDDTIITLHHLQFGNVVFLDRADYVWVQYTKSINSSLQNVDRDVIIGLLPIHHILFIPKFAGLFMQDGLHDLVHLWKYSPKVSQLNDETKSFLSQFDGFIFRYFTCEKQQTLGLKIRFIVIRLLSLLANRYNLRCLYPYIYSLIVSRKAANRIDSICWNLK